MENNKFYIYANSIHKIKGYAYIVFFEKSLIILFISKELHSKVKHDAAEKIGEDLHGYLAKLKSKNDNVKKFWDDFIEKVLSMEPQEILESYPESIEIAYNDIKGISGSPFMEVICCTDSNNYDGKLKIKTENEKYVFYHKYTLEQEQFRALEEKIAQINKQKNRL